jgi:branched-chain amino acid transport system ATP-binding protein
MSLLEIENLYKSFGKLAAINGVNLKVDQGVLTSVIGPNGAGKTTLFNLVSGYLLPDRGNIRLKGEDITGSQSYEIVKKGISRSFQITNIFPDLSVLDNIRVGLIAQFKKNFDLFHSISSSEHILNEALNIIESIGLGDRRHYKASILSHGERKILEFGLALTTNPIMMLLDEPTAGMNKEETDNTVNLIKKISKEKGITVILTEHDIDLVFSISDRIVVLNQGELIAEGAPKEIKANPSVKKAYLGED